MGITKICESTCLIFFYQIFCTLRRIVGPDNSIVCKLATERLFLCLSFIPTGFIPKTRLERHVCVKAKYRPRENIS